jgi:hypothetical protein
MPTTLRTELTKAGFVPGGTGTTMIVQDYTPRAQTRDHNQHNGSHAITSTDPILDRKFQNGAEWSGFRRMTAYDANYVYLLVNIPTSGGRFIKVPLTAAQITSTTNVPAVEENRFNPKRVT